MPPRWLEPHSYPAAVGFRAAPSDLGLFERTVADLRGFVLDQDVVYVGGGNTASLLAVWRMHGLDAVLREAWEAGIVLCGVSAGMNCWFEASTTDSFDLSRLAGLRDGLGLLPNAEGSTGYRVEADGEVALPARLL